MDVVLESYVQQDALSMADVVSELYASAFSTPPFNAGETEIRNQQADFLRMVVRSGFRLVLAKVGNTFVAFGYGYLLPADTAWWRNLQESLDEEFTVETGSRTFAMIEYGVVPAYRGRRIGHLVHDDLLAGSGAERATLPARPAAVETQALYRRWGWRKVGHVLKDPPIPSAEFDILVLETLPPDPKR